MNTSVFDGTQYVSRPPTTADAGLVVALMNACQQAADEVADMNAEELLRDWAEIDLAGDAILVLDADERAVAFADLVNRNYVQVTVYGFVHPDLEPDEQIALWRRLIGWGESWLDQRLHHAPPDARVTVQHFLLSALTTARAVLEEKGYQNVRTHYVMQAELTEPVPAPEPVPGIAVRIYRPGDDDDAIFLAGEESFQDMWNRPPSTRARWLAPTRADGFDPSLWFWAQDEESGEPAAICLCSILGDRGEVDQVGVRRGWRRRGVGLLLLRHALGVFQQRGIQRVTLSVDSASPTGAPRLYQRAGFAVQKAYARYEKVIRQ